MEIGGTATVQSACSVIGGHDLIVHKGNKGNKTSDGHQVKVSSAELINRKGNILRVKGLEIDNRLVAK